MEHVNKSNIKFWKLSVVLLAILNICLLATIWLRPGNRQPRGGGPSDFIISGLHLSGQQQTAFKKLRDEHHAAMISLRQEGRKLRGDLFQNLKTNAPDLRTADSMANIIAANQKQIEMVTFNHFVQVRQLCDDKQKQEFDEIIGEVTTMMREQGGPHPGRPGEMHPQGPPPEQGPQ